MLYNVQFKTTKHALMNTMYSVQSNVRNSIASDDAKMSHVLAAIELMHVRAIDDYEVQL